MILDNIFPHWVSEYVLKLPFGIYSVALGALNEWRDNVGGYCAREYIVSIGD